MISMITLTTDFGLSDPFVGIMKGVILSIAPEARLVDLTHEITPGDVLAAALTLESALPYFPERSVHLVVVDPGVGSERKPVAIQLNNQYFVGPDNGVFSPAVDDINKQITSESKQPHAHIVHLTNEDYFHHPVSSTFHGRDIFAPVAAYLARGVDINQFGSPVQSIHSLSIPKIRQKGDGVVVAEVIAVDHFGNLITNFRQQDLAIHQHDVNQVVIEVGVGTAPRKNSADWSDPITIFGISRTFSEVETGEPVAYFAGTGRLEIAIRDGDAAGQWLLGRGSPVKVVLKR